MHEIVKVDGKKQRYLTVQEANSVDGFLQTYMESDDGTEEKFSFDRFMLEQDKRWDGPYLIGDSDD